MSRFSGKCDLFDHIAGMGGWYDKDRNPVKFGQEGVGAYYSEELQDFEAFKKATDGVIYQHKCIKKITEWNHNFVAEHCSQFEVLKHERVVADKRKKDGQRTDVYYTYKYWGKEYTQKEISQRGVYITVEIKFDTLLDLIKYYPYIVSFCCSSDGKQTVYITNESFVDEEFDDMLQHGHLARKDHYEKELANHYLYVCKTYFLPKLDERTKQISLIGCKPLHNGYYELLTDSPIDYMHHVKFVWADGKKHTHWTSPKMQDQYTILISEQDIENYLVDDIKHDTVKIEYVEEIKHDLSLE